MRSIMEVARPTEILSRGGRVSGNRKVRRWPTFLALPLSETFFALLFWVVAGVFLGFEATVALFGVAAWVGLRAFMGLYPGYGLDQAEVLRRQTHATLAAAAIMTVFTLLSGPTGAILALVVVFVGLLFLAPVLHYCVKVVLKKVGLWGKPVVIVGAREPGAALIRTLKSEWGLGLVPAGVFDERKVPEGGKLEGVPYGGTLEDALSIGRKMGIDTLIFAMPHTRREDVAPLVSRAGMGFRNVIVMPNLGGITNSAVVARDFAGSFGVEIRHNLLDPWSRTTKRALDLFGVVVGGLLISPLLLAIALLIKLDSTGSALFTQTRPGRAGQHLKIYKFRTMHVDAEQRLEQMIGESPTLKEEFRQHGKLRDDPRVTHMGRFLRKTSLDELPQLLNVLKGEMSLVGPRPYLFSQLSEIEGAESVMWRVSPGISGLWQVSGRSDITSEERIALDSYYVRNWSVWLDLVILARTVRVVLFGQGAY